MQTSAFKACPALLQQALRPWDAMLSPWCIVCTGCFHMGCVANVKPSLRPAERGWAHKARSADGRNCCYRGPSGLAVPL